MKVKGKAGVTHSGGCQGRVSSRAGVRTKFFHRLTNLVLALRCCKLSLANEQKSPAILFMPDPEERAELLKQHDALVAKIRSPEGQARMIADGLDPEAELKKIN